MKQDQGPKQQKPQLQQRGPAVRGDVAPAAPEQQEVERGHSYAAGAALRSNHNTGEGGSGTVVTEIDTRAGELSEQHGQLIYSQSLNAKVPQHAIAAVVLAESSLLGRDAAGASRTPLRFEPYAFYERTGKWLVATHKDQAAEYAAFEQAKSVDEDAALQSVRVGLGQLQGGEAHAAGYADAAEMIEAMRGDEVAQIQGLGRVVAQNDALASALASEDWAAVAVMRAGPAYGALGYDQALASYAAAYQRATSHGGDDSDDDDDKRGKNRRR